MFVSLDDFSHHELINFIAWLYKSNGKYHLTIHVEVEMESFAMMRKLAPHFIDLV